MKKITFLPLLFLCAFAFGQKQFVVQNVTAQAFDNLSDAYDAAVAGDTIYLPGGGFTAPNPIEKILHWRGVGHYPDSTSATGYSLITNWLTFNGDCDGSTFEGIFFQSSLQFGSDDNEATGIIMKRCRVGSTLYLRSTTDISNGNPDLGFQLTESVIGAIDGRYGTNCSFEKNLLFGTINNFYRCRFNHNTFNTRDYNNYVLRYCDNCQFINNVFAYNYGLYYSSNCNFQNNLFVGALPYNPTTSNFTGSNNLTNITPSPFYITKTFSPNIYSFAYENNYHLDPSATGTNEDGITGITIIGTATDGTNPGIYGTSMPYKEGAVPYNPHIRLVDIDNEAVNGNLGVKITVAAQEK